MAKSSKKDDKRIGNQFWKFRTKHGRDKLFSTSDILRKECYNYFEWCKDNPLEEEKVFHSQGEITRTTVAKMRAMTLTGLFYYLKISDECWNNYRKRKDYVGVIREVEQVIYDQKFSGAAADMLNANIIARDLGLADKKDIKATVTTIEDCLKELD
jgi:hypothetical protein